MKIKGHFIQPTGPNTLVHETPYYGIRYNHNKAHLSNRVLGLQVLILSLGCYLMWINISESWLIKK